MAQRFYISYTNARGGQGQGSIGAGDGVHVRGWDAGVRVVPRARNSDEFDVYMTRGSHHDDEIGDWLGTVQDTPDGPVWENRNIERNRRQDMERGQPDQTVYTFEAGPGVTMSYPDDELWTRDYEEARAYAQEKGYQVIGLDYEFEDSELIDDFTPAVECAHCGTVIVRQADGSWEDDAYPEGNPARSWCVDDREHAPEAGRS